MPELITKFPSLSCNSILHSTCKHTAYIHFTVTDEVSQPSRNTKSIQKCDHNYMSHSHTHCLLLVVKFTDTTDYHKKMWHKSRCHLRIPCPELWHAVTSTLRTQKC